MAQHPNDLDGAAEPRWVQHLRLLARVRAGGEPTADEARALADLREWLEAAPGAPVDALWQEVVALAPLYVPYPRVRRALVALGEPARPAYRVTADLGPPPQAALDWLRGLLDDVGVTP